MQQLKDEVAERLAEMAAVQLSSSQPQQRTELDAEDDEEYVPGLDAPERDPSTVYTAMDLRRAGLTIKPVRVGSRDEVLNSWRSLQAVLKTVNLMAVATHGPLAEAAADDVRGPQALRDPCPVQ